MSDQSRRVAAAKIAYIVTSETALCDTAVRMFWWDNIPDYLTCILKTPAAVQ